MHFGYTAVTIVYFKDDLRKATTLQYISNCVYVLMRVCVCLYTCILILSNHPKSK